MAADSSRANDHGDGPRSQNESAFEQAIERFEDAWRRGERPNIDDYFPAGVEDPLALLVELIHIDLESRLKAGEAVRVELYLGRFPQLAGNRAAVLELIEAEYRLRRQRDPAVTIAEYVVRFPDYAEGLQTQLKTPARRRRRGRFPARLNCPHCHNPIEIVAEDRADEVVCPSCGSSFRLDPDRTQSWGKDNLPTLGKFELLEAVGRGAFGTVYRARDSQLKRIVAIKVPRSGRLATAEDEDRFIREARNSAQLTHAGIVPVYEVGRSDTFPYIVAEFVEGITLADALTGRKFGFRESAELLAQVAEALEHAHAHGVVHRDLKPSNIMLTPSGAPRLMDFGLAKREAGEITMTIDGQVLGTPAYMSPEQASGEAHHVDGRSDVYSLGVILYELLTGELPFRGNSRMLLHQVLHDEPRSPRTLNDRVPRDLETIALKCLQKETGRRYTTARDLAADLRRWLSGEPIVARPIGRLQRTWRWCKRKPLAASFAGLVGLLVVVLAIAVVLVNDARQREAQTAKINGQMLGRETRLVGEKSKLANLERESRKRADRQSQLALQTLRTVVFEVQSKLKYVPQAQQVRAQLLETAIAGLKQAARTLDNAGEADDALVWSHLHLGDTLLEIGGAEGTSAAQEALKQFEAAQAVAARLVKEHPQDARAQCDLSASFDRLGDAYFQLGDVNAEADAYAKSLAIAKQLADRDPEGAQGQRDVAGAYVKVGNVSLRMGDAKVAGEVFGRSLEIAKQLAVRDPRNPLVQRDLSVSYERVGDAHFQLGDVKAASDAYSKSLEIRSVLSESDPQNADLRRGLSVAYDKMGDANLRMGDAKAAREAYSESLAIAKQLADNDPQNVVPQRGLSVSYEKVGNVSLQLGDVEAAREAYAKSLAIDKQLAEKDPQNADLERDLSVGYNKLGSVELRIGNIEAAREAYARGLEIRRRLAESNPQNAQAQRDVSVSYENLADVSLLSGSLEVARDDYAKSIEIRRQLAQKDPRNSQAQRGLWIVYSKVGDVSLRVGDLVSAREAYENSLEIVQQLAENDPQDALAHYDLAVSHFNLGYLQEALDNYKEALQWFERAQVELKGLDESGRINQGMLRPAQTNAAFCKLAINAIANPDFALRQSPELVPRLLGARSRALARLGQHAEAAIVANKLAGLTAGNDENLYESAVSFALCAKAIKQPRSPDNVLVDETVLQERYSLRAVQLLKQARAAGYFGTPDQRLALKYSANLAALHSRDDFQELLSKVVNELSDGR